MNLEGTYPVCLERQTVGTVTMRRLGLYYEVATRCSIAQEQMLHLVMEGSNFSEDLGLLIPKAGMLELKRRIPVKRIGEGIPQFFLRRRNSLADNFVPITSEDAFSYLYRLEDCVFAVKNGQKGVILLSKK